MTEDKPLIEQLDRVSSEAKPYFDHYALHRPDFSPRERAEWLEKQPPREHLEELRKSVEAVFESHPLFNIRESRFFGAKQLMLHPFHQSFNILRVSHNRGPEEGVAWLSKVYRTEWADIRHVAEVHGLSLQRRIVLSNRVSLMPLEELPPSPHGSALVAHYGDFPEFPQSRPIFRPVAATREVQSVKATLDIESSGQVVSGELEGTIRAFALSSETSPIIGVSWLEFTDPDLALAEFGQMWMSSRSETGVDNSAPFNVDDDSVRWVERYIALPADVKRVCDIATERLALARRRHNPGNRAIEGAICLEALLGDGHNQELVYRLRLRAALLLFTNFHERQEISSAVRDFYELRSKTVHGARASPDEAQRQYACAKRGIAICADVLKAIVLLNKKYVPAEWELSGGRPFL
jgi:hypothetical protein